MGCSTDSFAERHAAASLKPLCLFLVLVPGIAPALVVIPIRIRLEHAKRDDLYQSQALKMPNLRFRTSQEETV